MSKYKKPFRLKKRGSYYYYKLPHEEVFHTTGETSKTLAEQYVSLILKNEKSSFNKTLREYAEPFYVWETCPHIRKLRDEKKSIGKRNVSLQRQKLVKYLFTDFPLQLFADTISVANFKIRTFSNNSRDAT